MSDLSWTSGIFAGGVASGLTVKALADFWFKEKQRQNADRQEARAERDEQRRNRDNALIAEPTGVELARYGRPLLVLAILFGAAYGGFAYSSSIHAEEGRRARALIAQKEKALAAAAQALKKERLELRDSRKEIMDVASQVEQSIDALPEVEEGAREKIEAVQRDLKKAQKRPKQNGQDVLLNPYR